jgi:hypothetical protein
VFPGLNLDSAQTYLRALDNETQLSAGLAIYNTYLAHSTDFAAPESRLDADVKEVDLLILCQAAAQAFANPIELIDTAFEWPDSNYALNFESARQELNSITELPVAQLMFVFGWKTIEILNENHIVQDLGYSIRLFHECLDAYSIARIHNGDVSRGAPRPIDLILETANFWR